MNLDQDGAGKPRVDVPVLIVGAGPTGLVLALWLTRLEVSVRIIDKVAEPGTTSRALAVQARTLEFYRQAGIADAVIEGGVKIAHLNFWANGARAARVPFQRIGEGLSPYPFPLVFPQDAHERLLIEQLEAEGVGVERRTEPKRPVRPPISRAAMARRRRSGKSFPSAFRAGPTRGSSTSRMWRQPGRPPTETCMSISLMPISCSSSL
jgi:hypothetical protein